VDKCPQCNIPLCRADNRGVDTWVCPDCGGRLVARAEIQRLIERRWGKGLKAQATFIEPDESNDGKGPYNVPCPHCASKMGLEDPAARRAFYNSCRRCGRYWFSRLEFDECLRVLEYRSEAEEERAERLAVSTIERQRKLDADAWEPMEISAPWLEVLGHTVAWPLRVVLGIWQTLTAFDVAERRQALRRTLFALAVVGILLFLWLLVYGR